MTEDRETTGEAVAFDLCGGHPALDFVNSLDNRFNDRGRIEGVQNYTDLLRFTRETRLLGPAQTEDIARALTSGAASRALRAGRALREALAATFYAAIEGRPPPSSGLEVLERSLHIAYRHRGLRWRSGIDEHAGLAWYWRLDAQNAQLPVWVVAHAALDLMLSPQMKRVRACEAQGCRWLFLDTSKNHTRRWCRMEVCGNRMKARRHRARRPD